MIKKEKIIVNAIVMVLRKHRHLGPLKLIKLIRIAFEKEIGYINYNE